MRVTFVSIGWESLAVSQLAALAKREGREVNLAFSTALFNDRYNLNVPQISPLFDDRKEVLKTIERQQPDVLAFSVLTGMYQWMLGIAADAKKILPEVKTVFGGVHVSAVPDLVIKNDQVDYLCIGEGDLAFPQILNAIERGGAKAPIANTWFKAAGKVIRGPQTGFIQDLDALPGLDKTLWEEHIDIGHQYFTMASRGCPYRCTFCFNNFFAELPDGRKGKYVRQRSAGHMMQELIFAKKRYNLRFVEFEDDVFTVNKKWVTEFLAEYKKEINVPFQILTHPKYLDEETARRLAEAGCVNIQMGIQSMDNEYKFKTIKRYEKSEDVERALNLMHKYKIRAKVDHMFGLPGEPMEAQEKAFELYKHLPPYRIQTFWTNFLPGTEMVGQALKAGLISREDVNRLNEGLDFDFYRSSTKINDPHKNRMYKAYELAFKLIQIAPERARGSISIEKLAKWPVWLVSAVSFTVDLGHGLCSKNVDHIGYAGHYLYHMAKRLLKIFGIKLPPATKIRRDSGGNSSRLDRCKEARSLKSSEKAYAHAG